MATSGALNWTKLEETTIPGFDMDHVNTLSQDWLMMACQLEITIFTPICLPTI